MSHYPRSILVAGALVAAVGVIGSAASSAEKAKLAPNALAPAGSIDPYAAYAFSPGLPIQRSWEFSGAFDSKGGSLPYRELRVKPGGQVDSCFLSRLVPDRC